MLAQGCNLSIRESEAGDSGCATGLVYDEDILYSCRKLSKNKKHVKKAKTKQKKREKVIKND